MPKKSQKSHIWEEIERNRDEPVKLPLDPETALRGLLAVGPESDPIRLDDGNVGSYSSKPADNPKENSGVGPLDEQASRRYPRRVSKEGE